MGGVAKAVECRLIQGEGLSFRASVPVLAALDQMVRDGVKAFPQRGLEVGGILMGPSEGAICLEAVRPLPMEYRTSPVFRPSPADLLFVKQSVLWAQASETGILGHFRSQTTGEPGPTEADQTIADLLKLPEPLLVLVPASAAGVEPARVYRRVNGEWVFLLDFPLMEFPVKPPTQQALEKQLAGPVLPMTPPRSRWRTWAVVGLVGLGCGAVLSHSIWKARPADVLPTRSDVHLQLHPEGTRLRVQWDPTSRPVAEGFSGILTVQDGGHRLQIPLDRLQLHAGSTVYIPESGWVEVRLEIYRDGNHYTGETGAMATGVSTPQPSVAVADPATKPDLTEPSPEKPAAPQSRTVPQVATKRIPRKRSPAASKTALKPPPRPAVLATTSAHPPDAPSGAGGNASASFNPAAAAIRYETAVPVRKVRPAMPASLHSLLSEPVSIEIKVEIDTAGKVASATPIGSLTAAQKLLAPQAVNAARLWRFQPARRNGAPVASESLLKFDFEPDAR
jgi:hypothetical protein